MIRHPRYRWARQEAEGPDRDPLLDARRIIIGRAARSRQIKSPVTVNGSVTPGPGLC
jgi:hypothetical protein